MWMHDNKITPDASKATNMGMIFTVTTIMSFLQSLFLAVIMVSHGMGGGFYEGMCTGGFVGVAFVFTTYFIDYGFEQRPWRLAFMNGMNKLVCLALQGGIIGAIMD